MIPALYFYRRDKVRRIASGLIPAQKKVPLSISETVLLLLAGAGFAQYGNFLMAILQSFINRVKKISSFSFWGAVFVGLLATLALTLGVSWILPLVGADEIGRASCRERVSSPV